MSDLHSYNETNPKHNTLINVGTLDQGTHDKRKAIAKALMAISFLLAILLLLNSLAD